MHHGKLYYVIAHNAEHNTYLRMWWSPGCHFYMYQMSDRTDEKSMIHSLVNLDPMYGNDLSIVAQESYSDYVILEHSTDYTG